MFVAIGAAKLENWWDMPRFFVVSSLALRQAKRARGNLHAEVFQYASHFFSLTAWERRADIGRFATSGPHRMALAMADRLTETSCFHVYEADAIPTRRAALNAWYEALPRPLQQRVQEVHA